MNLSAAADSGLTQTELAHVLGVSRVTVNLWLNGKMKPHRYNAENIRERLELLQEALRRGLIPKPNPKRKPRHEAIVAALNSLRKEANA
jgi:transcriptional regulator with XRE-family HTH domain